MTIYDLDTLPAIEHPATSENEAPTRYLGGRALTNDSYVSVNFFIEDNTQAKLLYDFWKTECDYGREPFLFPIPFNGETYDKAMPHLVAQFIENINLQDVNKHWKLSNKLKILGTLAFLVDDSGAYLVNDSGSFLISDTILNSNKEI